MTDRFSSTSDSTRRKLAIITGGTGGIGREIVDLLLEDGWDIFLLTRNTQREKAENKIINNKVENFYCDLNDFSSIEKVCNEIIARGRQIEILIHCAGQIDPQRSTDISSSALSAQLNINLSAPILLTSRLAKVIAVNGHIIFVNSIAGVMPLAGSAVYSATKFGLRGFARSLALEFRPRTLRISSVFLGAVDTEMLQRETLDGGSLLNYVSQPLSARVVARKIVQVSQGAGKEIFLPWIDGIFAHACLIIPGLLRLSMPILEKVGQFGLKRFNKRRNR
ncbi:SDR family NAD(P)-dependent oxidoreductase [Gluconobacter kanchanaburiensis]|uniref:SDR family NAD(P)-dependent oxidoreductase n=1 Tax=Gluconobacter kanchanaburiensis TaxID=563199 RepID=UPI0011BD84D2|nr:SDR family NAD(P)-dependent oxidoreductase [Gluconobacter kanchanaburiensis]MBF0861329.1 SDR family NAD(P)-dependent oxidoreductase [Gluconobacter kanchanaburiensis]